MRVRRVEGGLALEVVELGRVDAPPVVIVHGAGSSARFVVEAFGDAVTRAGARLVTYDQRGHGASGHARAVADHALAHLVTDLARVVDGVVGGPVALLAGVSLGAHVAVAALAAGRVHADQALALAPAWSGRSAPGQGPHAAAADRLEAEGIEAWLARIGADGGLAAWLRDTVVTDHARHDPASLLAALRALDGGEAPTPAEVAALTVPLTVAGWRNDPAHPWEVACTWAAPHGRDPVELDLDRIDRDGVGSIGALSLAACHPLRRWV